MARTEVSGSQIKDSSVALSGAASPTGTSDVTGVLPVANGGTGLAAPGASGNVLTSDGTNWTSAAGGGGGGGGGSSRVISTVTSATTLSAVAGTQYLTYIGSGGSVTLPTAVGNTSSYIIKNNDTTTKTIATVGDDASFASVTALVQGNGVDASTVFTDSAVKYTWAGAANVRLSTAVKKFGTASIYFGAGGNNANISATGFPGMGTSDFTIEMWFYSTVAAGANGYYFYDTRPFGTNGVYTTMYVASTQKVGFLVGGVARITGTTNVTTNTWHHVALSRSAGVTRMFLNGVQEGGDYTDTNNYVTNAPIVGNTGAIVNGVWAGYLDDIRITQGVGRYTSGFAVPTAEFPVPQLIDGTYPLSLAPNQAIELASSGSNWSVVSDAAPLPALTTTSTSATITTLTVASTEIQEFTGTTTQTVRLPSAGVVAGRRFTVINNSSAAVAVQSSAAAAILGISPGTEAVFTALVATPTTAAHWEDSYYLDPVAVQTITNKTITAPVLSGTVTGTYTLGGTPTISSPTLTTPVINGTPTGTGVATAATANTLVLRGAGGTVTGTFIESTTAVGTVGATTTLALAGTVQTATLTSNTPCTFTMPAVSNGASFVLYLRQPATGTPTTATFTNVRFGTGGAPVITAVLGRMDILTFFSDGTNWYGQYAQGFQY